MEKRLNKKIVVVLTIVGMAVTTGAGVVMVMNLPKKDPQPFIDQANTFVEKGEYDQARKYYVQAAKWAQSGGEYSKANQCKSRAADASLSMGDARSAIQLWKDVRLN